VNDSTVQVRADIEIAPMQPGAQEAVRPLRLGFSGLGWIGRKRLLAIARRPDISVCALADPDTQCLHLAAQHVAQHDATCTTSFGELLRCDLDAVVIATPSALHAEQAIAALGRGLAVFCQKPLAITATETAQVVAAARSSNRLLNVDYCYRHVRGMTELRERIRRGELGELIAIDLTFHNAYAPGRNWCFDPTLAGGGCIIDLGTHLIDLMLWLLDYPKADWVNSHLFAQGRRVAPGQKAIEDFGAVEFRLANGAPVRMSCSWNFNAGRDAIIEVALHGTRAGAAWRNVNGSFYDFEVAVLRGSQQEIIGSNLSGEECAAEEWGARALETWLDRLQTDRRFDDETVSLLAGARLIDACYQRPTGRPPVMRVPA
jgi:predicted dehydrogenase